LTSVKHELISLSTEQTQHKQEQFKLISSVPRFFICLL